MIDIKNLIKDRYAQDSDFKKCFDMPNSISKRILRKSCRKFKKSKISKEILISLIASAQSAPSKSNLQQYSILLIKNKEMTAIKVIDIKYLNKIFDLLSHKIVAKIIIKNGFRTSIG